jgi:hypothetical protein
VGSKRRGYKLTNDAKERRRNEGAATAASVASTPDQGRPLASSAILTVFYRSSKELLADPRQITYLVSKWIALISQRLEKQNSNHFPVRREGTENRGFALITGVLSQNQR